MSIDVTEESSLARSFQEDFHSYQFREPELMVLQVYTFAPESLSSLTKKVNDTLLDMTAVDCFPVAAEFAHVRGTVFFAWIVYLTLPSNINTPTGPSS